MIMPTEITALMSSMTGLLRAKDKDLALTPEMIDSIEAFKIPAPAVLPMLPLLKGTEAASSAATSDVTARLIDAAPFLPWRQTYDADDGFDQRFLDAYGWTDLAGPEGPYKARGFRLMLGYWGKGLIYPDHSHPPEEHYMVLAGSAWFRLDDDPFEKRGPGQVFHVPAGAVHSAEMRDEGLLAISIWRARDVSVRINLTDTDRNVDME
ncbi:MAG: dimethylsulfonioproprionate lyase family protein [Pseudomonadota bacterium]